MSNKDLGAYLAFAAATVGLVMAARKWAATAQQLPR